MQACLFIVSQNYIEPYLVCFYSLTYILTFLNLGFFLSSVLCTKLSLRKVQSREWSYLRQIFNFPRHYGLVRTPHGTVPRVMDSTPESGEMLFGSLCISFSVIEWVGFQRRELL